MPFLQRLLVLILLPGFACCDKANTQNPVPPAPPVPAQVKTYTNPVFIPILADPSVIKDPKTGYFYAFGTEDNWGDGKGNHLVAVLRSTNLVDWIFLKDAFATKPTWKQNGGLWAPDVNYINGKFYMYYSYSIWADPNPGIGLAIANDPAGPYTDMGKMFLSSEIGIANSIDPFYIEEAGKKYLFMGSYSSAATQGIHGVLLSDDGKSVPDFTTKFKIAAGDFEGAIIHKRNGYYYFFGSKNNCCEGAASIYEVRVARSASLTGPYLDKDGNDIKERGKGTLLIQKNNVFAGPGHNAKIITDDNDTDWFLYHAIEKSKPYVSSGANRRALMLDKLTWINEWPEINNATPSITTQARPVFK